MSAHTVSEVSSNLCRTIIRSSWICVLTVLLVVAALAVYRFASGSAAPPTIVTSTHASGVDPAAQRVLDYLRAHRIVQTFWPTAPLDSDQQGVMDYLRAHGVDQTGNGAPWDPAVQAVLDYLRAPSR